MLDFVPKIDNQKTTLFFEGEFEGASLSAIQNDLEQILSSISSAQVHLDFAKVKYIDSSGISFLVQSAKQLLLRGIELRVIKPSDSVQKVFNVTHLGKIIHIE